MIYPYFNFRIKQIARFLQQIGFGYVIVILFLLSGALLQGLSNFLLLEDSIILIGFTVLLIGVFSQRKDTDFLIGTKSPLILIYLVDASLIGVLVFILLIAVGKWQAALGIIAICAIVSFVWKFFNANIASLSLFKNRFNFDFPFLSNQDFEIKYFLRKHLIPFCLIYITALCFIWHPASLFVLAFISLVLFQSVLEYYESKEMIFRDGSPARFLNKKIMRLLLIFHLGLLPFYTLGLYFSQAYWFLYIIVFVSVSLMVAFSIFNKYVFYRPGIRRVSTNVIASIMLLFMLVPGFQLVVLVMSIIQYVKAKRNLNYYY